VSRPREITAAATVALIGSFLFLIAGLGIGVYVGTSLYTVSKLYGLDLRRSTDTAAADLVRGLMITCGVFALLGVIGAFTAGALLRMRPWARRSMIAWCAGSTFACLLGLVYPGRHSEFQLNPTAILVPMLFVFPINAWWLLLFYRPSIRALFAPPGWRPRTLQWDLRALLTPGRVVLSAAALLLLFLVGWRLRSSLGNSPAMQEIERAQAAVAAANSWHYHRVRDTALGTETIDTDTVCPSFQHAVRNGFRARGQAAVFESIVYSGRFYNYDGESWVVSQGRDVPIFECLKGAMGVDETSLPFPAILEDASVRAGAERQVEGVSCRDYEISVPTPHDPAEKDFRFAMCISEADHLPVQTRRTLPGAANEVSSTYSMWRAVSNPELPLGFPQ